MDMLELEDYILQGLAEGKSLDELTAFVCEYGDVQREEAQLFISQIKHGQKSDVPKRPIKGGHVFGGISVVGGMFIMIAMGIITLQGINIGLYIANNFLFITSGFFLVLVGSWLIISQD